jgi:hypothetical protein
LPVTPDQRATSPAARGTGQGSIGRPRRAFPERGGSAPYPGELPLSPEQAEALANELEWFGRLAAEELERPVTPAARGRQRKTKKAPYRSYDVPIDWMMLTRPSVSLELNYRLLQLAFKEDYGIRYYRSTLRLIMQGMGWSVFIKEEQLERKIAAHLDAGRKTIQYRTKDIPRAIRWYTRYKEQRARRFRDFARRLREAPDFAGPMIVDFYKAQWNGIVTTIEGLGDFGLAQANLYRKLTGEKPIRTNLGFAKFSYSSPMFKRDGKFYEAGVALGLPFGLAAKAPAIAANLTKIERFLRIGPRVRKSIKALMVGTAVSDVALGVWDAWDLYRIAYLGVVEENGEMRLATKQEIQQAKEQLVLHGLGAIASAGVSHSVARKPSPISKPQSGPPAGKSAGTGKQDMDAEVSDELASFDEGGPRDLGRDPEGGGDVLAIDQRRAIERGPSGEARFRNPKHRREGAKEQAPPLDDTSNPHFPTTNIGLTAAQMRAGRKLFGSLLTGSNFKNRRAWKRSLNRARKAVRPEKVALARKLWKSGTKANRRRAKRIMRTEFGRMRKAFWKSVKQRKALVKNMKKAGLTIPPGGKAPYYTLPDGRKERVTLEHTTRVTDDPMRAADPDRLMLSLGRENSGMLEQLRRFMPRGFWDESAAYVTGAAVGPSTDTEEEL